LDAVVLRLLQACGLLVLVGCGTLREGEDPAAWFDSGRDQGVDESLVFTQESYSFPASSGDGIGTLIDSVFPASSWGISASADDQFPSGSSCDSEVTADLPFEIEGRVTLHPRYYFKSSSCDGDEKYYGSFFIEDSTGGIFVLGDTKVSHFSMGDHVRLRVRAVKTTFDLNMVYGHDVLEITRGPEPIHYELQEEAFDLPDVGLVKRVEGTVVSEATTFGEFDLQTDAGQVFHLQLDMDLSRRGISFDVGTRLHATGPVMYSYSAYSLIIIRLGQITVLD